MYDIPERTDVRKCIITEETIRNGRLPLLLTKSDVDKGVDETNYEEWLATRGETAYVTPARGRRPLGWRRSPRLFGPRPASSPHARALHAQSCGSVGVSDLTSARCRAACAPGEQ